MSGKDSVKNGKTLAARNLEKSFKGRRVVNDVSVSVNQGEVVGLLGPNGAGKSTTFYMIVGRIAADAGSVFLGDEDLSPLPMYQRARRGLGYLPQEPSIFRHLSVVDNLDLVLQERGLDEAVRKERVERLLSEFGLEHVAGAAGYSLSGGERRRVEIARCIASDPFFILLDEPFSGIDPIAVADLQEIIRTMRRSGYGILLTDHNVRETLAITDRTYLIHEGKVMLQGSPAEIAEDPNARKYYLGEGFSW